MANDAEGGNALAAWLGASSTLAELARTGVIPRARALELTDNALLVVERLAETLGQDSMLVLRAHSALQEMHQRLRRDRMTHDPDPPRRDQ